MVKKVAIITIQSLNFGNRLQNYALQSVLESLGCRVETINRTQPLGIMQKLKKNIKKIGQFLFQTRGAKFYSFDKRIHKSHFFATADIASEGLASQYDYFVAGSDQIWNPHYKFNGKNDFLTFAREEQKIAYAASFGVEILPENKKKEYKQYLKNFSNITVREESGARIIEQLTGKKIPVVLDPTLIIEAKKWRAIAKCPKGVPKRKYVLIYALGEKNDEFQGILSQIKENNEYELVDINKKNKSGREWEVGPEEFIYLIDNADLVLTDSFHATVFWIMLHSKVCVFERMGLAMSSRIDTLLKTTELQTCKYSQVHWRQLQENELDFNRADELIDVKRNESLDFLKKSLVME